MGGGCSAREKKRNDCISRLKGMKLLRIQIRKQEQKLECIYKSGRTDLVDTLKNFWFSYSIIS